MFPKIASNAFAATLLLASAAMPAMAEPAGAPAAAKTEARANAREQADPAFRAWIDARAGTGQPVHWVAEGGVYEYPSGRKLFGMMGFDSSRVIWPEQPGDPVIHLTRKTFAYTDPVTGEVITEFNGQPVAPIAYPYQMISYRFENGEIFADVEQGTGDRVQTVHAKDGIRYRHIGKDTLAFTASIFLDAPLSSGARYEAWENYDFFIQPEGSVDQPYQMSWQRFGSLPAWAGGGKAIYHLLSWRVESQDDFPAAILDWAKSSMPMWLNPPADIAEVRRLQRGDTGENWAK